MKYWNALLHGSRDTKRYLWSILIGGVLTVISVAAAVGMHTWVGGAAALLFGIITLFIWQSRELTDKELEPVQEKEHTSGERKREKRKKGKEEKEVAVTAEKPDYGKYSEPVLKKAMQRYRVKKGHKTVMIDSCVSKGIKECPAYLWRDRRRAYFLLLEETPRRISYPLNSLTFMEYRGGVETKQSEEYQAFQETSLVSSVFRPYLPGYYQVRKNGMIITRKNLYAMAGDLLFTNTSVRNVMDVLQPGFRVQDAVTEDSRHGAYFIECYQQNILLRDGILEVKEYKEHIRELLQNMAKEDMPFDEFRKGLEQMVEYRFITDEFADYYIDYRQKWKETQEKKQGRKRKH